MADDALPLDAKAELAGEWWQPDDAEATAYGLLTYTPEDGLLLRLTSGRDIVPINTSVPWLHGLTVDGRPITLRNCSAFNWSLHIPGGVDARVRAEQAFVGMHAASDRELSMLSLSARMVNLREWVGITGIAATSLQQRVTRISYTPPSTVYLGRNSGALFSVFFEPEGEATPPRAPFTLRLEQQAWFETAVTRRRPFDDLLGLVVRFSDFLSFAAGIDSPILELVGSARVPVREFGPGRVVYQRRPVWVLYHPFSLPTTPRAAERMLFRFEDVRARKLLPLTRWYRHTRDLEPVRNLYLSALPTRPLHIEYRFLAFAQALEAYHFRKQPKRTHLQRRLQGLVDQLPAAIRKHVPSNFAELTKDTRNYFTHWYPKLEAKAARGDQLITLTFAVKLLFELTMLDELGFGKNQIAEWALRKNQRLVHDMRRSFLSL
jgi:hypothetical protein